MFNSSPGFSKMPIIFHYFQIINLKCLHHFPCRDVHFLEMYYYISFSTCNLAFFIVLCINCEWNKTNRKFSFNPKISQIFQNNHGWANTISKGYFLRDHNFGLLLKQCRFLAQNSIERFAIWH